SFFFSSRRRHTRSTRDWSSDVCSSDLERFGDGGKVNCEIEYVKQRTPRGTADAVAAAGDELKAEDRFLVMYGDDYYEKRVVKDFLAKAQLDEGISIATAPVEDASPFGVIETKNGRVAKMRENLD